MAERYDADLHAFGPVCVGYITIWTFLARTFSRTELHMVRSTWDAGPTTDLDQFVVGIVARLTNIRASGFHSLQINDSCFIHVDMLRLVIVLNRPLNNLIEPFGLMLDKI